MAVVTCVPTELYPYIYNFLLENGLSKSAKCFKKETGSDYVFPSEISLLDMFSKYISETQSKFNDDVVADDEKVTKTNSKNSKKRKNKSDEEESNYLASKKKKVESTITGENNAEDDDVSVTKIEKKKKKKPAEKNIAKTEEETENENTKTKEIDSKKNKKMRKSENEATAESKTKTDNPSIVNSVKRMFTNERKINTPFRRVKEEDYFHQTLQNNSFEAKKGSTGDWGEKANQDLKFTRGKGFRHEKTKKKRGSYKGGSINTSVNSIKFEDSE